MVKGDAAKLSPDYILPSGMSPIRGKLSGSLESKLIETLCSIKVSADGIETYLSLGTLVGSVDRPYENLSPDSAQSRRILPFYVENDGEEQSIVAINSGTTEYQTDAAQIQMDIGEVFPEEGTKYLVLDESSFLTLRELVFDKRKRQVYLGEINQDESSKEIYLSMATLAIREGASDLHLEPQENGDALLRFRIDGKLQQQTTLNPENYRRVVGVIKNLADLDIAEKRRDQDGRINLSEEEGELFQRYSLRVSVLPSIHGENVVMRVLQSADTLLKINDLGLGSDLEKRVRIQVHSPEGINVVVGPTGSGKTSTLYAYLQELNDPSRNISSVEDPAEIQMNGINQFQVNEKTGMTFSNNLRSLLRQDPDVIMVGEVRDKETAYAAIDASTTGHAVFATLHANSAIASLQRFDRLGIHPKDLAHNLRSVLSQRLVRQLTEDGETFKGRFLLPELWVPSQKEREMIYDGQQNPEKYIEIARNNKLNPLVPLVITGIHKVNEGLTTIEELMDVILPEDFFKYKDEIKGLLRKEEHGDAARVEPKD